MPKLINFAGFQLNWLICVLGAAKGWPWAGPVAVLLWVLLHMRLNRGYYKTEWILILTAAIAGYLLDSVLVLTGYLAFPEAARLGYPSTLWMVALWINLATTLRHSLGWLQGRVLLCALFGGAGGAAAYYAGERLGAIYLPDPVIASLLIGLLWSLALPALYALANKLEQGGPAAPGSQTSAADKDQAHG